MRRKQDLHRLEQTRRSTGTFQELVNLSFVPVRHRGNDSFFVGEITIDQAHADPSFGTDIVHAGLVESALGETSYRRFEDLGTPVGQGIELDVRHEVGLMNDRTFIVNSRRADYEAAVLGR